MDWATLVTALVAGLAALLAYVYSFRKHSYWQQLGVPTITPVWPFIGNLDRMVFRRDCFTFLRAKVREFRERGHGCCGMYLWHSPLLLVWDPEMVKQILCKDFASFHDRLNAYDVNDPLSAHLFNLPGAKWRNLRNKLTPAFTSGKLKLMFPLIRDIAQQLSTVIASEAELAGPDREVDVLQPVLRFATDVIGSCAFGIDCHCLQNENKEFMEMAQGALRPNFGQLVKFFLETLHPRLGALLPFKWIVPDVHRFFISLMRNTVEHREKHGITRPDFVHLMMQLRDQDLGQSDPEHNVDLRDHGMMAAQGFIFFVAGLDNPANTVGYCLTRLAADTALQDRVVEEVNEALDRHGGEMTYQALKEMELLDNLVLESLRCWQTIGVLLRKCTATTTVGDLTIRKGQGVFLFEDDSVFPDFKRFDPDRHTAEARAKRHQYSFLPFGEGPRVCIAERFAMLEMKIAIAVVVRGLRLKPGPNFEHEPVLDTKMFLPKPKNGFRICVQARQ